MKRQKKNSKSQRNRLRKHMNKYLEQNPIENRWALIYGTLPPETKKTQAKAFNEREDGLDFLVSTNAIGMGLNLNINRVIFTNIYKRIRTKKVWLEPSEIMQIAGRAGRYKTDGYVSAFSADTLKTIREVLDKDKSSPSTGGKYKEIVKEAGNIGKENEIEINIDSYQNQESDDETEDNKIKYVHAANATQEEQDESNINFDKEIETEYVIEHKFSRHQSSIK